MISMASKMADAAFKLTLVFRLFFVQQIRTGFSKATGHWYITNVSIYLYIIKLETLKKGF